MLEELNTGRSGADPVGLVRTAIEYSHSKLDPAVQQSLATLAPFTAAIPDGPLLAEYQNYLDNSALSGTVDVVAGVNAAVAIGLASPHESVGGWVRVVPVLPYFLRQALQANPQWWDICRHAHYQLYASLGEALQLMITGADATDWNLVRNITNASHADFIAAIDTALDTNLPVLPVLAPVEELLDRAGQHLERERLLRHAIIRLRNNAEPPARRELAHLLHLAGMVALKRRQFEDAEDHYSQALALWLKMNDRHRAAGTYQELGRMELEQRRFQEAENIAVRP